jgi:hypothetical protein
MRVPNVSSDRLRQRAQCSLCSKRGATIQRPGWGAMTSASCRFPSRSERRTAVNIAKLVGER